MSFNNDEDGDGLAALFGGITPQGTTGEQPGPRRRAADPDPDHAAADAPPGSPAPAAPPSTPVPPSTPAYEMPAPGAYDIPAPRAYEMPAPAAPPSAAPPASPAYPGLAPAAPRYPDAPAAPANPYAAPAPSAPPAAPPAPPTPTPSPFPQYGAPVPTTPAYPPTAPFPAGSDPAAFAAPAGPAYGAPTPAPVAPPPSSAALPSAPPAPAPPLDEPPSHQTPPGYPTGPSHPAAPSAEAPPTYSAPGLSPTSPAAPVSATPAYGAPADPPPPIEEPPAFSGFEALGFGGAPEAPYVDSSVPVSSVPERPAPEVPSAAPVAAERPVVRAEPGPLATGLPPGPLLPAAPGDTVDDADDIARATLLEKIGLALAVLTGPIGLLLAIVNAVRSAQRRGWVVRIVRASLALGVLSTFAAAIGGYTLWNIRLDQLRHDQVAAASAEFCAAGRADPSIVTPPTLGWPRPGETITDSLALMQEWTDNWRALSATSPAALRDGMDLLAERGDVIIEALTASRSLDDAADTVNREQISSIEAQSGVSTWFATYCLEP